MSPCLAAELDALTLLHLAHTRLHLPTPGPYILVNTFCFLLKLSVGSGIELKPFDIYQSDRTNPRIRIVPGTLQEQSASEPITLRAIRVTGHPYTEFHLSILKVPYEAGQLN